MKLVLATFGTTGDIQPFLALGVELHRRGHTAVLAAPPNFASRAAQAGLEFAALGTAVDDPASLQLFASAYELQGVVEQVQATLSVPMQHAEASMPALLEAAEDADALVSIPYQAAGRICAELLGRPYVSVHFSPFGSSRRPDCRPWRPPTTTGCAPGSGCRRSTIPSVWTGFPPPWP